MKKNSTVKEYLVNGDKWYYISDRKHTAKGLYLPSGKVVLIPSHFTINLEGAKLGMRYNIHQDGYPIDSLIYTFETEYEFLSIIKTVFSKIGILDTEEVVVNGCIPFRNESEILEITNSEVLIPLTRYATPFKSMSDLMMYLKFKHPAHTLPSWVNEDPRLGS